MSADCIPEEQRKKLLELMWGQIIEDDWGYYTDEIPDLERELVMQFFNEAVDELYDWSANI